MSKYDTTIRLSDVCLYYPLFVLPKHTHKERGNKDGIFVFPDELGLSWGPGFSFTVLAPF